MKGSWSREEIASGLRLAGSGVPVVEVTRMMGVSPEVFSAWRAEYAEVLDKLIIRSAGQNQPNAVTKTIARGGGAHLNRGAGGGKKEKGVGPMKIRDAVNEKPAARAG